MFVIEWFYEYGSLLISVGIIVTVSAIFAVVVTLLVFADEYFNIVKEWVNKLVGISINETNTIKTKDTTKG